MSEVNYSALNQLNALRAQSSRREFLKTAAALGLSVPVLNALGGNQAHAAEPKKGGTLRLGMEGGSSSDTFDPTTIAEPIPITLALCVFNGLIEYDADGNPGGELLESWEAKPGAAEWVFNVRKDITFSNGKVLDADDIIYSINLHRGESKSAAKGQLAAIQEIKTLSANQIYIRLSAGNADFPVILGDYHLLVVPNGHTDWSNPIGTGAFVLEAFEPGVRATFTLRGGYWKPGRGNFDRVEVVYIQDPSARTTALQSGEIDAANRLDPRTVKLLMQDANLNIVQTKGTGNRYCFMARVTDSPFDNKDLRLALKYGIDREQICRNVFSGFAVPGNDHLLDARNPFYNAKMPQRTYDPDKAAFHFKKAGLAGGAGFDLKVSDGAWTTAVDCSAIYQQSLKKAGIDMGVTKVAADGYWSDVWQKVPFCAVVWARRMSADQSLTTACSSGSDYNDTTWRVPAFDSLLAKARIELDPAKRAMLYGDCQQMIADDGGQIVFAISDLLDGYSSKVQGVKPHARFELDDCRIPEKGWFA